MLRPSLCALLLCALLPSPPDEAQAEALLERAQLRYTQGKYAQVQRTYADLAKRYPGTAAGRTGERRSQPNAYLGHTRIVDAGPPSNRVDIVLMNDGYTVKKQKVWNKLAETLPRTFERQATFKEYVSYFNFVRCNLASEDDNVTGFGRTASTALGGHVIDSVQGHVAIDAQRVHAMLDELSLEEHDGLVFAVVRAGSHGTGGGGIACIGAQNTRIAMHEWGHAFAELGDEYVEQTHRRAKGARYPNIADTDDPEQVPWAHWIAAKARGIGVYEGADGQVRNRWKPKPSGCVMQDGEFYCEPCREAIVLAIYRHVDPIESVSVEATRDDSPDELVLDEPLNLDVHVMLPASHKLEVSWYVFSGDELPAPPQPRMANARDRRSRGPLAPISRKADQTTPPNSKGRARFRVSPRDLGPGRHRIVVRVRDKTMLRGARLPWVLEDKHGLLESERGWWVHVPE